MNVPGRGITKPAAIAPVALPRPVRRIDRWFDKLSDYVNPILVKETRQALKSRQFLITFSLLLIFAWGWSMLGVALMMPGIYYAPGGPVLLAGYFVILAFPLLVIVPYAAFRSLASERDDGTFELLSISSLSPRQIVAGKLCSAVLQIMIYLSVLSPCIAFTYLLRGVDILLIGLLLFFTSLASLLLSVLALFLATVTHLRHWQIVMSVLLIVTLAVICISSWFAVSAVIMEVGSLPYQEALFWIVIAVIVSLAACLFALLYLAATARLTFRSENRSTPVRVAMLVTHLVLTGWMVWFWRSSDFAIEVLLVFLLVLTIFWWFMGSLMIGESTHLAPRARRRLPRSLLGRMFLSQFYPGPAQGFRYAASSLLATACVVVSLGVISVSQTGQKRLWDNLIVSTTMCVCYAITYLGLGRLLLHRIARRATTGPPAGLLLQIVLLAVGATVPLTVQFSLSRYWIDAHDYKWIQASNVFWTLAEAVEGDLLSRVPTASVPLLVGAAALCLFFLNLLQGRGEYLPTKSEVPLRVQEDQQAGT